MSMLVGAGLLFNQPPIPAGSGTIHSTPGNISGKKQVTFKLSSTLSCTGKVYYCDGDPTDPNTVWYLSPTTALQSISLSTTPVILVESAINAGWVRIDVAQQGGTAPVVTGSFATKAQD